MWSPPPPCKRSVPNGQKFMLDPRRLCLFLCVSRHPLRKRSSLKGRSSTRATSRVSCCAVIPWRKLGLVHCCIAWPVQGRGSEVHSLLPEISALEMSAPFEALSPRQRRH